MDLPEVRKSEMRVVRANAHSQGAPKSSSRQTFANSVGRRTGATDQWRPIPRLAVLARAARPVLRQTSATLKSLILLGFQSPRNLPVVLHPLPS